MFFSCSNGFASLALLSLLKCQIFTAFSTALSRLAHNVRAAWRRRGVRYSSCGTQTFNFPLHFLRRYTPACAKPPVARWHLFLEKIFPQYFYFLNCPFAIIFMDTDNYSNIIVFSTFVCTLKNTKLL